MTDTGIIGIILIIINIAFSYQGFRHPDFFDRYKFEVDPILIGKDYKRFISSGFLHVNLQHLIFNMISLYFFSGPLEVTLGGWKFSLIYFASMIGGDLLSLFVHRNHGDYSAVGASGAISGIIFACIALFPGGSMGLLFLPIQIPNWLFGLIYVGYSIYGIKSRKDNIGHEAHLGGALIGMATALLLHPSSIIDNYITILLIAAPAIIFIYLIVTRPHILLVDNLFFKTHTKHYNIDQKFNEEKNNIQHEVDRILDKISKKGINSISKAEREILEKNARSMKD